MLVQTSGNDSDGSLILSVLIKHGAEDNVSFITGQFLNIAGSLIGLNQADIAGNIDDDMAGAFNGSL